MTGKDEVLFTNEEIREKYDAFAPRYDRREGMVEWLLGVKRLRRRLLDRASGSVLEVAAGTGKNIRFYPPGCRITAVDLSRQMLEIAQKRAERLRLPVTMLAMDAESLDFPDETFDTVVSSLSTCTFPHPVTALREMGRVCRPGGRILLLEHGRSSVRWIGRLQDRLARRHAKELGCQWNREPLELVHQAGLEVRSSRRSVFGIFHVIEAAPSRSSHRVR